MCLKEGALVECSASADIHKLAVFIGVLGGQHLKDVKVVDFFSNVAHLVGFSSSTLGDVGEARIVIIAAANGGDLSLCQVLGK